MTRTELLLAGLIAAGVLAFVVGATWLSLGLIVVAGFIGLNSAHVMSNDPPYWGIVSAFGTPLNTMIAQPRLYFASAILVEEVIAIPEKPFNWDYNFHGVECNINNVRSDEEDFEFEFGGTATVEISYTGGVIKDLAHGMAFVKKGRAEGVEDIFEDRLNGRVRAYAIRKSISTFVGEKKPFAKIMNELLHEIVDELGLEEGSLVVKKISPEGEVGKYMNSKIIENLQRVRDGIDNETMNRNAAQTLKASQDAGDTTMTFDKALEIERIRRGNTKEVVLSGGSKENKTRVAGALVTAEAGVGHGSGHHDDDADDEHDEHDDANNYGDEDHVSTDDHH